MSNGLPCAQRLFFRVFALCLFCGCTSHHTSNRVSERDLLLKYKIGTVREFCCRIHLGIEGKEHLSRVKTYNNKGLLTQEMVMGDSGVDYTITNEYDKNNNQVLTTVTGASGRLLSRYEKSYDGKNNLIQELHFEEPGKPYLIGSRTTYDGDGRKIETVWFTPEKEMKIESYKYDGANLVADAEHDMAGKFLFRWTKKYDRVGNVIEMVQYFPDSLTVNGILDYKYNTDNELEEETDKETQYAKKTILYRYNNTRLLVSKTEYGDVGGGISAKFRYVYE